MYIIPIVRTTVRMVRFSVDIMFWGRPGRS